MKPEMEDVVARKEGDKFKGVTFEEPSSVVTSISTSGTTTCSSSSSSSRRRRPSVGLTGSSSTSKLLSTSSTSQKSSSMRELTKKSKSGNDKTTISGAKQSRRDLKKVPALDTVSDSQNRDPPSHRTPHKQGKGARSSVARQKHRGLELASPVELPSPPCCGYKWQYIVATD